ncbi:MAG: hypothetical protein ACRYFX_05590 [Janthinobacterium lividum]
MKYVTYATALILCITLVSSCQKEETLPVCQGSCTIIQGQLVTGQSQMGIGGAGVTVKWLTSNGLSTKSVTKARTSTDANGSYQISFFIEDAELKDGYFSVFYDVDKDHYYTIGQDQDAFYKLKRDTTIVVRPYQIPRKAYVRLAITNPGQITRFGYSSSFNACYGHNLVFSRALMGGGPVVSWDGLPVENPLPVAGDQSILVQSNKTKNGITTFSKDSLFIPAGTTQNYTVTY